MLKKAVILAGGLGTRLQEETGTTPKPLVTIGGKPILWHIMKIYSHYGCTEFIICLGYKGHLIKDYFSNYLLHNSDVTFELCRAGTVEFHSSKVEPWKITLVDTGLQTQTGGRIQRIKPYVEGESFMLTYGDGVADIDIKALVDFHLSHNKIATVTGVRPAGKFGVLEVDAQDTALSFTEKPMDGGAWINGGFFVLNPEVFDYLSFGDDMPWERAPMGKLVSDGQLMVYKHEGFWECMDTLPDRAKLEKLWQSPAPPWKAW